MTIRQAEIGEDDRMQRFLERAHQRADLVTFCAGHAAGFGYLGLTRGPAGYALAEFGGDPASALGPAGSRMRRFGIERLE